MKIEDVQDTDIKTVDVTIKISEKDKKFIDGNKISIPKLIEESLKELRKKSMFGGSLSFKA